MKKKIRKFENHSITRRLYLLFSLICLLFLVLIARLGYMQITHQAYYTDKLAKATKKTVNKGVCEGKSMMLLVNPWWKMWANRS